MTTRSQITALTKKEAFGRAGEEARIILESREHVQQWYVELVTLGVSIQHQIGSRRAVVRDKNNRRDETARTAANAEFDEWRRRHVEVLEKINRCKVVAASLIREFELEMPPSLAREALIEVLAITRSNNATNGLKVKMIKEILETLDKHWSTGTP